jgi:peptidoglycan/xylan/chitin deacetylase (PgdA/CDA1 family)
MERRPPARRVSNLFVKLAGSETGAPTMTRFHIIAIGSVIVGATALALHHFILLGAVVLALLIVMGLGVAVPQLRLFGNFICRGKKSRRCVALTFDDGPDPRSTPQLLELLRAEKTTAAFFCIGKNVAAHPKLAGQIVGEGHLLENHSYAHSNFTNFYSTARLQTELAQTQAVITQAARVAPKFFRPPVGLSNPATFRAARNLDLQVVGWSIRSLDTVIGEPEKIVARITRGLQPGAIVLLHDGNIPAEKLLATVKSLLDTLRELGYEIVRLDELLK